ncbi:TM2 domain-containing protein [bacterium]|nr:TM2 domain-containing protein [bacterium]
MADEQKEWLTTLLLCIFLGTLGVHRFYTGYTKEGVIQLLTCGGCVVWTIIDLVNIITNKFMDAQGRPLLKT